MGKNKRGTKVEHTCLEKLNTSGNPHRPWRLPKGSDHTFRFGTCSKSAEGHLVDLKESSVNVRRDTGSH
jgi:hypothetical protein